MVFIFSCSRLACHCGTEFSKAHLKSNDTKASHSFMPQRMKNVSDKYSPTQTHIFYLNAF